MTGAKTTVIVGATGFLGEALSYRYQGESRILTSRTTAPLNTDSESDVWTLDLLSEKSVAGFCERLQSLPQPINIIYAAADHHPDKVEKNPSQAKVVNIDSLSKIVEAVSKLEAEIVYVSSDTVFGGSKGNVAFTETDATSPLNEYGRQKALAEKLVLRHGNKVARCSFMFGYSRAAKLHFCDNLLASLEKGESVEMMSDSYRSPLSFDQVADFIFQIQRKFFGMPAGVIHIASSMPLTKYEVALQLARSHSLDSRLVVPIRFEDQTFFNAPRAKSIVLDTHKLESMLSLSEIKLSI